MVQRLEQQPGPDDSSRGDFDREYQRAVFRWAQTQVRPEFQESTWDAFWLTAVQGQSVEDVAGRLGKTFGAVYAARSRVMRRLKEAVRQFEDSEVPFFCTE
jgi:RNA polymerase sigma-70 factor (ECF subfamily)